ncbi:MAG: UDP-N-acetylmuramoyl-L-alanine--D-glutamate ligase [Candidatus Omnitrophica bacterium]|nr:UDP-N-acetylmuramoyl-L-alanine--D-glutamate ligase [Candidatus Omnitrophota bacterium]
MRNTEYFTNKKIAIIGLARSGLACANLLYSLGSKVSVTDNRDNDSTRLNASMIKSNEITVELGRHTKGFIQNKDLVVVSPGVANDAQPVIWAREFKIPVISEIELAWLLCPATVIAVTGSNGKTTVTTLIGKILQAQGRRVFVCGNIGTPFSSEVEKMNERDYVSLEVSSFQLEGIDKFKPKISVILNFTRNHLDRYKNMQEYLEAKKRIFRNQDKSDYLVLNSEDPIVRGLEKETNALVIYFSQTQKLNPNQAAVLAVASILGIDEAGVLNVTKEFKGIEHRLEFVGEINNIRFINDSKATTADSAAWALKNINGPVILIAGGVHKGVDYGFILELARKKIKQAILIGEARNIIKEAFAGSFPTEEASTLEEAVSKAFMKAAPGDCVLLSPMCSSFDMFSNYEERGNIFKRSVYDLIKNNT